MKERRVSMPILKQHSPTGQYLRWTDSWKNKLVSKDINRPKETKEKDFFTKRLRKSLQLTRMSIQSSNLFQSEGTQGMEPEFSDSFIKVQIPAAVLQDRDSTSLMLAK